MSNPPTSPLHGLDFRHPTTNLRAELTLLSILLIDNVALAQCAGLRPFHFVDPVNALVFGAIQRRINSGGSVTGASVKGDFAKTGELDEAGGPDVYLTHVLFQMNGITNTAAEYAKEIQNCWLLRQMIDASDMIADGVFGGGDAAEILDSAIDRFKALRWASTGQAAAAVARNDFAGVT